MAKAFETIWGELNNGHLSHNGLRQWLIQDVNGDGLEDLLSFGLIFPPEPIGTAPLRLYRQNADGSFTVTNPMTDGSDFLTTHPRGFASGDFNGDGIADLFIASSGYDTNPFPGEPNRLLLGTGNGTFIDASYRIPALADFSHRTAAADIDNDGDLDIYVANIYGQQQIGPYLLLNDGNGNFALDTARLPASVVNGIPNREKFLTVDFADLDGDGYQDLLLGGELIPSRVYWGSSTGHYSDDNVTLLPFETNSVRLPHQFIIYDFNNDGRVDILNAGGKDLAQPGALQLLINDGARGYLDRTTEFFPGGFETESEIYGARLVDINSDGWLDIIRTTDFILPSPQGNPLIWLNDGTNHFQARSLEQLGMTDGLFQASFLGENGDIRWLSHFQHTGDADGRVNYFYYKPSEHFNNLLPAAPKELLTGAHDGLSDVARFFNTLTGTHFYTAVPAERDGLRGGGQGFVFEGNAFDTNASAETGTAVFRFFNTSTGTHFYTASLEERDSVITNLPGLNYEGIAYYAYAEANQGRLGLHRFLNTQTGTHFYTASQDEKNQVEVTLPQYQYEGISYYVDIA